MPTAIAIVRNDALGKDVVTGKITLADPAAAANISIGFIPSKVVLNHVTNVSDYEWNYNMDDGTANLRVTAGDKTLVAADAITPYTGDAAHSPGFTIGADSTLNTAGDVVYFTATR
jgi:hypothetical protein